MLIQLFITQIRIDFKKTMHFSTNFKEKPIKKKEKQFKKEPDYKHLKESKIIGKIEKNYSKRRNKI